VVDLAGGDELFQRPPDILFASANHRRESARRGASVFRERREEALLKGVLIRLAGAPSGRQ
jgi:hypothetical protein